MGRTFKQVSQKKHFESGTIEQKQRNLQKDIFVLEDDNGKPHDIIENEKRLTL